MLDLPSTSFSFQLQQSGSSSLSRMFELITISYMGKHAKVHPTAATAREKLPAGYTRSSAGFLLHMEGASVKVDQELARRATEHLQKHAIVAYFVGGKQPPF